LISTTDIRIEALIQPETDLEARIIRDELWRKGAFWGKPRYGHPEGKVILHIREVLDNVDRCTDDPLMRRHLRLVTIIHDTFKYLEDRSFPRKLSKHHAVIAYKFARDYVEHVPTLNTILLHDNAYYAWQSMVYNREDIADRLLQKIYSRMGKDMQLFYLFFKCDTLTGDKTLLPLEWFERTAQGIQPVEF
jgi:hypothetical protein